MSAEFIYAFLVGAGVMTLLVAGVIVLARFVESVGASSSAEPRLEGSLEADNQNNHRLSVSIAEALMENRMIDPSRFNEVAQIVAFKLELQSALGNRCTPG
jgi:hypothetical protein